MLYAILCYDDEAAVEAWSPEQDARVMEKLGACMAPLAAAQTLGPVARLGPTQRARTLRKGKDTRIIDGPFAETKEALLGFYVVEAADEAAAMAIAQDLAKASESAGAFEVRPLKLFRPGALA